MTGYLIAADGSAPDPDRATVQRVQGFGGPLAGAHCFYSEHYLVTVRREDRAAFAGLRAKVARTMGRCHGRLLLLHHLLDERRGWL